MSAKQIAYKEEARNAIKRGVNQLARAVKSTLGPCGRNVIIEKSFGSPTVTKDGVTVAKEIELSNPYENMGAQMVREVASKTSTVAGDGTTTATVYAEAIYEEGLKNLAAGAEAMELQRGIKAAVDTVIRTLREMKTDCKGTSQIAQVGTCAANQDEEIGRHIAHAMEKVGKDGVITVEEGKTFETTVDLVEGMQFDKGYLSPHFINKFEDLVCEFDKPVILIHEKKLSSAIALVPILEKVAQSGRPLVIIAEDIEGEALTLLVVNKLRGTLQSCAIKAPGFGDRRKAMLQDIATLTGATAVFDELGIKLDKMELKDLGTAKKIRIDKENSTIVEGGGKKDEVKARISQIKGEIDATTGDYDREKLQERLARLSGGIAQINVCAVTEVEMKEKKARVEDALHACRAAVEEGILPGGGVAVVRALPSLEKLIKSLNGDQRTGADIVRRALVAPIKQIATNAGLDGSIVLQKVQDETKNPNYGYNALTGEYGDMIKMGVLSSLKVERTALQNAASVAGLLLTTDCVISEIKEKDDKGHGGHPGMGDMGM